MYITNEEQVQEIEVNLPSARLGKSMEHGLGSWEVWDRVKSKESKNINRF